MPYRWKDTRLDLLNGRVPQASSDTDPVSASVTAKAGQRIVSTASTAITVTLPASPAQNTRVTVIRAGTGQVTVDGNGETICGETSQVMLSQYDAFDLVYTDSEWVLT